MFIRQLEIRELRMRLLHPFETSFGATQDRIIVLVKVTDGQNSGWGEVTAGHSTAMKHGKRHGTFSGITLSQA
jgi:L-alanine-DL-glutamate epimerase-like enolase superfamily enzyme